jgi:putative tricarboxylic transport membrane protein
VSASEGGSASAPPAQQDESTGTRPSKGRVAVWFSTRHELVFVAFLVLLSCLVLTDAIGLSANSAARGPVGPKTAPVFVGSLLLVCAVVLAIDVVRGRSAEPEGGEDVDPHSRPEWRPVGLLIAAFVANIFLINRVGFPISGAILFWGSAFALGSRHWIRDPFIAVVLSIGAYVLFNHLLGVSLPGGLLGGVI